MPHTLIDTVLSGAWKDPETGESVTVPTREVVIGTGMPAQAASLLSRLDMGRRVAVVMDVDTKVAVGEAVLDGLASSVKVSGVLLGYHPHPDMDAVRHTIEQTRSFDGIVAVGSGSINDITKHAAHLTNKPFAVFGTAPSMNGYTSTSAAITVDGLKKSLPSTAARGVFLDLDVLSSAPKRLIAAGFGDSICRCTAQFDWLLAHLVQGSAYREAPFALLKEDEDILTSSPRALVQGDKSAIAALARTLVLSGFGMSICGGSYPASQSEHLIAHYIDMLGTDLPLAYHGEHIAVTTLSVARLQERVLSLEALFVRPDNETVDTLQSRLGPDLGRACWEAFAPKRLDAESAGQLQSKFDDSWPAIRAKLSAVIRPSREIERMLIEVGAPTLAADVGISREFYREALSNARLIRDRFGVLDLAASVGELDRFIMRESVGGGE